MSTYKTFGAGTYSLSSSIGSTDTSINLSSFTEPVSGVVYTMALLGTDIVYGTIAPGTTSSEFISFTGITNNGDGTATLTGVVRGLAKKTPFTTSATFKLPHSSQTTFIISNSPQVYEKFAVKSSDETIGGQWTFTNTPISPSGGVSDASTTVKGVSTLSVAPVSATAPIAVGTNDPRMVVGYGLGLTGIISPYAGATAPTGWLLCDGSAVSLTTYAALYAIVGVTYGNPGGGNFNLPDMRGRVPVGKSTDTEFDGLGETGGEKTHALSEAEMPAHTHTVATNNSTGTSEATKVNDLGQDANVGNPVTTNSTGSGTAHNNLQPYITLNYIIKY